MDVTLPPTTAKSQDGSTSSAPPQKIASIVDARKDSAETRNACTAINANQFELLRTLGTGTFARVWLVRPKKEYRTSGSEFYALKVLKKKDGALSFSFFSFYFTEFLEGYWTDVAAAG